MDTLTKTKSPAYIQQTIRIDDNGRTYGRSIYPFVQQAMRDGVILLRRSSYLCSRDRRPYRRHCEAECGGGVKP